MTTSFKLPSRIVFPNKAFEQSQGVGMTSQRTRNRLIQRLQQLGIVDVNVLKTMLVVPRSPFFG